MPKDRVELLAPAGSYEGFVGALNAGADAIYLGGRAFGARAYAENLSDDDLLRCITLAHMFQKKVYLTVNTLVKEREFSDLYTYLKPLYEGGLDGIIVQDLGVLRFARHYFPKLELHASTQMTLTDVYSSEFLKDLGVNRIVPARELSLAEIKELKSATGMEIECFVHGAMCYCYSGQCLFSSILGGRSGNRGRCAQPCRLPYKSNFDSGKGECFPLSLKDLSTLEILPKLIEAGIDSFKIEGRMKKPEYAAGVTAIYRKYIDLYYSNKPYKVDKKDLQKLSSLYIRGEIETGYYERHNGKEMITLKNPSYNGSDNRLTEEIRNQYIDNIPKISVNGKANFRIGKPANLQLEYGSLSVSVDGFVVELAGKAPVTIENIEKQLRKLGDSFFIYDHLEIHSDEQIFIPLKALNELRREAVSKLEEEISLKCDRVALEYEQPTSEKTKTEAYKPVYAISFYHLSQVQAFGSWMDLNEGFTPKRIEMEAELFLTDCDFTLKFCEKIAKKSEVVIAFPYIIRQRNHKLLGKLYEIIQEHCDIIHGVLIRNLETFVFLKQNEYRGKIYTDSNLYVWNRYCLEVLSKEINGFCLPIELNSREKRELLNCISDKIVPEQIVYGRIPMMITANCVAKSLSDCKRKSKDENSCFYLKDRYNMQFPVQLSCKNCYNIILNSVPILLREQKLRQNAVSRIQFTTESEKELEAIMDFFVNGKTMNEKLLQQFTTGHEKRGVE